MVTTPLAIVVDAGDVRHLRAEDETGAFGILPGHADFLTVLSTSVVSWRGGDGIEHYLAVRGGMLEVRAGQTITIATREAIAGDELQALESRVLGTFRREAEQERTARADTQKLYVAAIREISRLLRSERAPAAPGGPRAAAFGSPERP